MLTARPAQHSARLSADGAKIILGPGTRSWTEFCQSLPNARWDSYAGLWKCDATPAAAWRIIGRPESDDLRDRLNDPLTELAFTFGRQIKTVREGTGMIDLIEELATELGASDKLEKRVKKDIGLTCQQPAVRKNESWAHQLDAYFYATQLDSVLLAMGMGCGKSKVVVDVICNTDCRRALVLCPTSVRGIWRREFERHAGRPVSVIVLDTGTVADKAHAATGAVRFSEAVRQPLVVVINYESAWRDKFASFALGVEWDIVVCDESHRIKTHNSQISKFCAKLGKVAKKRICLTGTPLGQSPLDVFGQFRFLEPGIFGTSWHHFANRYAVHGNPHVPQQITGFRNQEELQERFHLITYRCKAEDVLDLPEAIHEERTCELGPAARKAYRELEDELITQIGEGVVTAGNALVKLLRLQQVTSGFLGEDESDRIHEIDTAKQSLLRELLEDAGGEPFVVFCRFRHDLAIVRSLCEAMKLRYGELSGSNRDGLTDRGEMSPNIDVLGCQIQSGGVGIDLTRARLAAYYSLGFSLTEYEQSLARLHRPGQTRNVAYYHLIAEKTCDRRVYSALRDKKDVIEAVIGDMNHAG